MKPRGVLAFFAGNHVAANILMAFLMVGGALALARITVEVFPELDTRTVTIRVPYLGAAPAEVEEGVVMRVEEAIAGVEGIERIRSVAQEGSGTVIAELEEGADTRRVLDDIKNEVDRIETFPDETEKPVISEVTTRRQVISMVLHGDVPERTLKVLAEQVRDDLTAMDVISQVEIAGVRNFEVSVEVSEEAMRRHGLTFDAVAGAVRQASLDLPGGSIKSEGGEILLRAKGQLYRGRQFEQIVVLHDTDGTLVRLADVATVQDTFEDSDVAARFDDAAAATVRVFRVGNQGALEIADTVKRYAQKLADRLPTGVNASLWEDDSEILRSRLDLLLRNARIGLVLVFLCLALFLDLRLAFWTTMGIPISFLGAFLVINHLDVTVNMISLFAFIVSLGIVVDDAIVVGENVYAYRERGMPPLEAAVRGVREMAVPVTFAILTTVAAFLPLAFTAGRMGQVMRQIPIVVVSVLLISLLEALVILPAHLAAGRRRSGTPGAVARLQRSVRSGLQRFIDGHYASSLALAVRYRYVSLALALATFLVTVGFVAGGHIRFTFMPRIDADNIVAELTMPQGTPIDRTREVVKALETAVREVAAEVDRDASPGSPSVIRHVSSTIGNQPRVAAGRAGPHGGSATSTSGAHLAEVNVELRSSEDRNIASTLLANRWRERVGEVPGVSALTFSSSLFSVGEDINVELSHQDFDTLLASAERLKEMISSYPGVGDVADSFLPGKAELSLALTDRGRALGLTLHDLARQVRQGFYGEEAQRIQRGRDDVRVMVRYPEQARRALAGLDTMRIRLAEGREIPLNTVAAFAEGRGYAEINRTDRRRVVSVTASVDQEAANANEINSDLAESVLPGLVRDVPGLSFSFEGARREQAESMGSLGLNFVIAQIAIFALLAIPFRSYAQPLIVMSAIPFGLIGAVLGHVIMGYDLSMLSGFGVVALTGVVVNDSLIMIDLINRERREGVPLEQVILDSGTRRFRPILLTTLTTFFGLVPMILERSLQARFLVPMAISLAFGVLFATAITLLLVPALYRILEDVRGIVSRSDPAAAEGKAA